MKNSEIAYKYMIKQSVREEIHNLISQNDYDDNDYDIKPSKIKINTNITTKKTMNIFYVIVEKIYQI